MSANLTIRQLQLYAAICLCKYCSSRNIKNELIDELIHHLIEMPAIKDVTEWDKHGSNLKLSGRGDALPDEVVGSIPKDELPAFKRLVESAVEVGIVDLYGPPTNQPMIFFEECIHILLSLKISPPRIEPITRYGTSPDAWGPPLGSEQISALLAEYREDCGRQL